MRKYVKVWWLWITYDQTQTKWIHREDLCCFALPSSLLPQEGGTVWGRGLPQDGELVNISPLLSCTSGNLCWSFSFPHCSFSCMPCQYSGLPWYSGEDFPSEMQRDRTTMPFVNSLQFWFIRSNFMFWAAEECSELYCKEQPVTFCGSLFFWNKELFKNDFPLFKKAHLATLFMSEAAELLLLERDLILCSLPAPWIFFSFPPLISLLFFGRRCEFGSC